MIKIKHIFFILCILFCITSIPTHVIAAPSDILLNDEEKALIKDTQNGNPLKTGIVPNSFPLSATPPEVPEYVGINLEMLEKITEISGLEFEYYRIPVESKTPFQFLETGAVDLVAGTIKLNDFINNPQLILSDRICDGSATCIARRDINIAAPVTNKIAVLSGYQAGREFAKEKFPNHEILRCSSNQEAIRAVRTGQADLAMISRYVGIYELQNPLNEDLIEMTPYQTKKDSCVMGLDTQENQVAVSIINKALAIIGEDGYNYIQMNFSITNPYKLTFFEFVYKYRYLLISALIATIAFYMLVIRLVYAKKEYRLLELDPLTGAFSEAGFELAAKKIISKTTKLYFITDLDISRFSEYNELNGKAQGDKLLKDVVDIIKTFLSEQDVICRSYADHFKVLSCKEDIEGLLEDIHKTIEIFKEIKKIEVTLNFGVYPIVDNNIPISKMLDFAVIAKKSIKQSADTFVGVFNASLLENHLNEAKMIASFSKAIENKEFVAYYQPKFDTETKTITGAEALVRWIAEDGTIIPPFQFIDLFEKSGQIQQLDFYMLDQVCTLLSKMTDEGMKLVPIAVNFSRVHLYSSDFVEKVNCVVEKHGVSKKLIEIECTENTIIYDSELTRKILGKLQDQGYSIAMDDFGSAYSSLNTLCSIPLDVLKLDRGFLLATLSNEKVKANTIIRNVMSLAHDLSLKVVAEGVETEEQYMFLKGLGCDYIQGFYFSKPLNEQYFLELIT